MAIQASIETNYGFTSLEAYAKINSFSGNKDLLFFDVFVYMSADARTADKPFLAQKSYELPYVDGMSISSLYDYLKTLPEYINPLDV